MTDIRQLIAQARARGLTFYLEGGCVKIAASQEPDVETKALLNELRRHREEVRQSLAAAESANDDPILTLDQWYPEFRAFHHHVVDETPDLDFIWLRQNRPDLYRAIKVKESEIDALQSTRLSEVMAIMRAWRDLILRAVTEQRCTEREQAQ